MRRPSERKRRSTPVASASKRKRGDKDVQRQDSGESAATVRAATTKSKPAKPASSKARRCLGEKCRKQATVDSWYCPDTCAVNTREVQFRELLRFKSNLADWRSEGPTSELE